MRERVIFLAILVSSGFLAGLAAAQDSGERSSRDRRRSEGNRRAEGERDRGPGGWGDRRGGSWGDRGPEDRRRMYDNVAEHQLRHFSEDYELTREQRDLVRARLDELKVEQARYMEPLREEFEKLGRQMHDAYSGRRGGQEVDQDGLAAARERMREIWSGAPLMNPERATEAIEQLLPDQQVEKGRLRRAERSAEMEQRFDAWRQSRGDRDQRWSDRGSRERGPAGDYWDRYVESFERLYQLEPAQRASAQSVLDEMKKLREARREAQRRDYEAAAGIEDRDARREAYEKLNQSQNQLFEQLKERLMRIPTNAQRNAVGPLTPASRPSVTTRPDRGSTSRPSDDRSDGRRRGRRGG